MKISIVIPAYNSASMIHKCINSILSQKGAELEIVVVNDGSTDNTLSVLEEYAGKVKVISIENGGVANARNVGLANASGDFLMFVDSDDALSDGAIETLVKKQNEKDVDIVRFEYFLSYDGRLEKPIHFFEKEEFIEKKDFKEKIYPCFINGILMNSICLHMYRREVIKDIKFSTNMKTAEDACFSLNAYKKANNVLIVPKEFYIYNQSPYSLTGGGLSIYQKYRCNIILSNNILKSLKDFDMNTPYWIFKTALRPLRLTLDKINRIRKIK
ncbi:MAG: glycosyltransferase family 2 protein [Eubacteriales bacterium]|nr:glycosyltransferase family 2 protein [Eubacteriales bacterium]